MKILLIALLIFSVSAKEKKFPKVYTQVLNKKEITDQVDYYGKLMPLQEVKIYSPISGIVLEINATPGAPVKRGQILGVVKQNLVGLEVMPLKITSPINGNLYRSAVEENYFVNRNNLLFTVYNPDRFKLRINVAPDDGNNITIGDKLNIKVGENSLTGKVKSISPDIDIRTGTRLCEIVLDKKEGSSLRPGMLAKAAFEFNQRKSFLVEPDLVKKRGGKRMLRLVGKDSKVEEVEVTIKKRIRDMVEIETDALKDGRQVITQSTKEPLNKDEQVEVVEQKKL